jgi:hypothetical protein|tara:strand:+ start:1469 stop:2335 length:867 start_codon:yes stop_codon:yes gene_type:complete
MARKLKHSKIKNTGILFELLTRQITADVLNGKNSKAVNILKKYFNDKTQLGKEKQLYEILIAENYGSEEKANRLVDAVVQSRQKLVNSSLRREKYNLIKEIKDNFINVEDFFRARIPNYKLHASIYKLFLSESAEETFDPTEQIDNRYTVVNHLVREGIASKKVSKTTVSNYKKQEKDLRLLAYEILVERFNKKYKSLNEEQKNLLREYINNISNTNSLKEFIENETIKLRGILSRFIPKINDQVTKIKLKEAINQLESVNKGNIVKDKQVVTLMRYYELIKELKNVC